MGCVSSTLLNQDEEFPKIGGFSHHIVSLTSTTYGLLTLDPPPADPQPPETINAWDLMSGLDSDDHVPTDENSNPNFREPSRNHNNFLEKFEEMCPPKGEKRVVMYADTNFREPSLNLDNFLEKFEEMCPPKGEKRVVLYSTSLRGVRKTFEDCEVVRSAIRELGIPVCERDISMHKGFRDELRELMKGKTADHCIPPRLFVKGRYVGGADEVIDIVDRGTIASLLQGFPKLGGVCEGCGGVGFFPCFSCHGSCKIVKEGYEIGGKKSKRNLVLKCSDCNENGLVICPMCS